MNNAIAHSIADAPSVLVCPCSSYVMLSFCAVFAEEGDGVTYIDSDAEKIT